MPVTITLNWTAAPASEFVSKYEVYESVNGGAFAIKGSPTSNSFTILNPLPGNYRWQVRAVNFVGSGPFSAAVDGPGIPAVVADLTVDIVTS